MTLYALHGFLGKPSDWNLLQIKDSPWQLEAINLFKMQPIESFDLWTESFNLSFKNKPKKKKILIGYSLGGRLALHALIKDPELWEAAVIISAHLGLSTQEERAQRCLTDGEWASRFELEPWDSLMKAWNNREVFHNESSYFNRQEDDYCRKTLAAALREWSLGKQENLRLDLAKLDLPILWIVGSKDTIYLKQAQHLHLKHPLSRIWVAPNVGHRVPWLKSTEFLSELIHFLKWRKL